MSSSSSQQRFALVAPLKRSSALALLAGSLAACGGGSDGGTPSVAITVPGAPTVSTAAPGDASANISFTAPSTDGGAAITGYTATCTAGSISRTGSGMSSPIGVSALTNGTPYTCSVTATNSAGAGAASVALTVTPAAATGGGTSSGTAAVLCGISGNEATVNGLTATYSWTCNGSTRALVANGLPNHTVGTFPRAGNPNTIGAVATSATYTLNPSVTATSTTVVTSGYGLNGVKLEPATAGTCADAGGSTCNQAQGTGAWNMEALGQTAFNFGTDENNAHVQPTGAYHYHGMPEEYITKLGKGTSTMTLVGWAPDGFPIYARYGYNTATNAASGVKVLRGSYRLKTVPDANRPSTTTYAMGTFTQDYEYAVGSGDLDECNGRTGVTPEFPAGTYHYVITDTYPYIGRCVKGTPASIR
jgi:YHYH protein/Fibronectin type III domain